MIDSKGSVAGRALRCFFAGAAAAGLFSISGCATFSSQAEALRNKYGAADFASAETIVDEKIASESGADVELVRRTNAVDPDMNPRKGDTLAYLLDKGMIRLSQDDPETALRVFRTSRDALDANFEFDTSDFMKEMSAVLTDDSIRSYKGADYDHIMVRAMLALSDLVAGGGDAYPYAVQIGEKQEQIIGSPLGEVVKNGVKTGYRPREHYSRVALGAYLQGIIREDSFEYDEAARAFERALAFASGAGEKAVYDSALARVRGEKRSEAGHGAVHVFYFGGRGPHLVETRASPTDDAIRLAGLAAFLMTRKISFLAQAPVPVPAVQVNDANVLPLNIEADGRIERTETVLDVNRIAVEQLRANMPWIMARAVLRRAVKASVGTAAGGLVGHNRNQRAAGEVVSLLVTVVSTAAENADTRSWSTLPATVQTARLDLPAGEHLIRFDNAAERRVRVSPGRNSYILVVRPSREAPPAILLDKYSLVKP